MYTNTNNINKIYKRMKKQILWACTVVVALLMGACNEDDMFGSRNGNSVTFNVGVPELASTRAIGDGFTANTLYWGVYDHDAKLLADISNTTSGKSFQGSGTVSLTLAKDKKYSIIFWAANADNSMCTVDWNGRKMTVNPTKANQEAYDAFCAYEEIDVTGYMNRDVKLKRPFAQINIGTADSAKAAASGLFVQNTKVEIAGLHTTYDFVTGKSDGETTFGYNYPDPAVAFGGEKFPVEDSIYDYLSMNYALISADKKLVDVTFTYIDDDSQEHTRTYASVPVQRNWRTNIYGNILTSEADFKVTIVPEFMDEAVHPDSVHNIEVWDGKTVDAPVIDEANKTVTVATGNQLAWLAASVNGTLPVSTRAGETQPANPYNGWTILLDENIDLGGEEWTPIGLKGKRFMGTFDGQGHTISNLKISTADNGAQAALFGDVNRAVIKNFTIDNANVLYPANYSDDFYGAAVVSQAYMVTLQKITVKNSTIQGNNKVAAILAHDADGAAMVIEDCHVEGCTIETKNDADGGNAAGIVGSVQGSKSTKSLKNCSVKNTTFNVLNSADAGKRSNAQMVATIIATAETVVTLEDCVVEGNTFNQSGVENFVSQYDGIFVGGARTEETGTVIINGRPYGALKLNNDYYWSVEEALKAAKAGDVIYVGSGNYVIPASVTTSPAGTITFEGYDNKSVLSFNSKAGGADGGLNSYADGMDLVFKNLKVVSPNTGSTYSGGFGRAKSVAFEGCTYEGQFRSMSPVTFTGCTIDPMTSYIYTDYSDATFTGCTFNCSEGKGIQVYNDGNSTNTTINVENCTFTAAKVGNTWDGKPVTAIDINSNGEKFTVNITNTTATGFGKGIFSNSQLWNIKGGEANVTVTIDNNLAYPFFTLDEETGEYTVTTAQGIEDVLKLAGAAGAGNSTINIASDIDLTGVEWTPIKVDGYHGADIVTVNGNGKTITGLTGGLFAGGFAGGSGIVIKNLTIANSTIIANNTQGYGAFVGCADSMDEITLINCHLINSSIITPNDGADESRIGGLIGWTAGYNVQNDGPVDSYITVKECSVEGCTLKGAGSIGGIVGHAGANAATFTTIEDCTVTDNKLISTDDGGWRVGVVVGTANNGQCAINNIIESGNTLEQTGKTAPTGEKRNLYGRFVPAGTGTLVIDGVQIYAAVPTALELNGNKANLTNLTANHTLAVSGNGTIVLDGTSINAASGAAITLADGANVTLELKNGVSIIGETDAIAVPEGATLTLKGETQQAMLARTRTATANEVVTYEFIGNAGSGINAAGATVTIENLHGITAKGNGDHAFGIGGNGANVTIKNSTIDYVCGGHIQPLFVNDTKYGKSEPEGGAAIGGTKIKIEGSTITKADGGSKAAAIGAQYHQSTDIEILNSTILEANGGNASAGVGGSRYSSSISAGNKQSAVILIANSTVTATGGQGGAGIGSGYDTHCAANDVNAVNDITIISSNVTAQGGKYAAGIGTGFHAAALTGSIDAASTIKATSGEAFYKDAYSTAQNIGYGVVDPTREFAGAKVTFTVAGKVIEAPFDLTYSNGTYTVYTAAGLVDLSSKTIKGSEKVLLGANIDLQGVDFNGLTAFNPESNNTFDGQNYTVSNWTYKGGAADMGFIKNWVGSIKNVSFYNCNLKTGGRSAVVVAKPYANIENVHVDACSIEDSYWACGLIAGMHNSGSVAGCTVTNSSVKSNGGTGAIVGVLNETGGTRSFTKCSVTGSTINNTGVYGEPYSGAALVGMINISNATVKFKDCSQSGNTFVGGHVYDAFYAPASDDITIVIE